MIGYLEDTDIYEINENIDYLCLRGNVDSPRGDSGGQETRGTYDSRCQSSSKQQQAI